LSDYAEPHECCSILSSAFSTPSGSGFGSVSA
jgi:hypothetical protein